MDYNDPCLNLPLPTIIVNARNGNLLFANSMAKKERIDKSFFYMLCDKADFSHMVKDNSKQKRLVKLKVDDKTYIADIAVSHHTFSKTRCLILLFLSLQEANLRDEKDILNDICDVFVAGRGKSQVHEFLSISAQGVGAFCSAIYQKKNRRFVLKDEWRQRRSVCVPVLSEGFGQSERQELSRFRKLKRAVDMQIVDYKNEYNTSGMVIYFFDAAVENQEKRKLKKFVDVYSVMTQDSSKNDTWTLTKSGLDAFSQAYVMWETYTKRIIHANSAYKKMFGINKHIADKLSNIISQRTRNSPELTYTDRRGRQYSVTNTKTKTSGVIVTFIADITAQKEAEDKLNKIATTDVLTGLNNRRAGKEHLRNMYKHCKQNKTPLTVCFADIDGLKHINDTYGHGTGDVMIKSVADVLKKTFGASGLVCRFGGDEFVLILPNMDKTQTVRLTQKVANITAALLVGQQKGIYMSFGFKEAEYKHGETADALISIADSQMYVEKRRKARV